MERLKLAVVLMLLPLYVAASDTLTLVQFQDLLLKNHPLITSANLNEDIAESYLIKGQGVLDPKFYTDYDGKQFKDINYFRRWNSEVKIPTKYPVDVSIGYENNSGEFLNGDNDVPSNGLLYGTVSVSLLRGLLFDEQRFALRESELLADKSRIERELIIRNIIVQSLNAYVDWAAAFNDLIIADAFLDRVSDRHLFIIQLFENGDKPSIDTIESRINLNTALKNQLSRTEDLIRKRQKLNMFLWDDRGEPMVLVESVVPQNISVVTDLLLAETIAITQNWNADPLIRKKQNEIDQISLVNRLEREQLKPQLDIKFNTIHSLGDGAIEYSYNVRDYKVGATILVPLRNRKTQGQIDLNNALISQKELDQTYYRADLQNMYQVLSKAQSLNQQSLEVSIEKVENSRLLYEAEQLKFELGESSVFLLNSRERKLLESETEYIKNLKALSRIYNELYFLKLGQ